MLQTQQETFTSSIFGDALCILHCGIVIQFIKLTFLTKLLPYVAVNYLNLKKEERNAKQFCKQAWGFLWHVFIFSFAVAVSYQTNFWLSVFDPYNQGTSSLFTFGPSETISDGIKCFFVVMVAYYSSESVALLWSASSKDDYLHVIHHVSTLALVTLLSPWCPSRTPTLLYGYKLTISIFMLHEVSDLVLSAARCNHYSQMSPRMTEVLFTLHLPVWVWARLVLYPRHVYGSVVLGDNMSRPHFAPALAVACLLYVMHIYWTYLMMKIFYRKLWKGQELSDVREKEEMKRM